MKTEEKKATAGTVQERAAELQREYVREYRRRHPEKVREWNRRYWERKAQKAVNVSDHAL